MVVQILSVREYYHDGIIWLKVPSTGELNYSGYISICRDILHQMGDDCSRILQETVHVPGESGGERRARELQAMARAKKGMISYLQGKRVLMVLDGVGGMDDMSCLVLRSDHSPWPWFLFTTDGGVAGAVGN
jgi:hypothetical protein